MATHTEITEHLNRYLFRDDYLMLMNLRDQQETALYCFEEWLLGWTDRDNALECKWAQIDWESFVVA